MQLQSRQAACSSHSGRCELRMAALRISAGSRSSCTAPAAPRTRAARSFVVAAAASTEAAVDESRRTFAGPLPPVGVKNTQLVTIKPGELCVRRNLTANAASSKQHTRAGWHWTNTAPHHRTPNHHRQALGAPPGLPRGRVGLHLAQLLGSSAQQRRPAGACTSCRCPPVDPYNCVPFDPCALY